MGQYPDDGNRESRELVVLVKGTCGSCRQLVMNTTDCTRYRHSADFCMQRPVNLHSTKMRHQSVVAGRSNARRTIV